MIERTFLPEGFDEIPAGLELAVVLATIDRSRLNGYDVVRLMRAHHRQIAHAQAEFYADMYELAGCGHSAPDAPVTRQPHGSAAAEFVACEVSAALTLTRTAAETEMGYAYRLPAFPAVHDALRRGEIDQPRAKVILDGLAGLESDLANPIAEAVLAVAAGRTAGQLRAILAGLVIKADPRAAKKRYDRSVADRRVVHGQGMDHTAYLSGSDLPADRAERAQQRINAIADGLHRSGDARTMDQLRADVYLDLLEGVDLPAAAETISSPRRGKTADIVIPVATMAGYSQDPGIIPGWGPVLADVAGQMADQATDFTFAVTDDDGTLLFRGRLTVPPPASSTAAEYAFVAARDRRCVFPTCRTPASRCDTDHTVQRKHGGEHHRDNLATACRHHHRAKDEGGWLLGQLGRGRLRWTSPMGHTYTVAPEPLLPVLPLTS